MCPRKTQLVAAATSGPLAGRWQGTHRRRPRAFRDAESVLVAGQGGRRSRVNGSVAQIEYKTSRQQVVTSRQQVVNKSPTTQPMTQSAPPLVLQSIFYPSPNLPCSQWDASSTATAAASGSFTTAKPSDSIPTCGRPPSERWYPSTLQCVVSHSPKPESTPYATLVGPDPPLPIVMVALSALPSTCSPAPDKLVKDAGSDIDVCVGSSLPSSPTLPVSVVGVPSPGASNPAGDSERVDSRDKFEPETIPLSRPSPVRPRLANGDGRFARLLELLLAPRGVLVLAGVVGVRFPGVGGSFPIVTGARPVPDFAIPPFATPLGYNTLFVRTPFSCTIVSSMLLNADAPRSADSFSCTKRASVNNL